MPAAALLRRGPLHRIDEDSSHLRLIIIVVSLVTGSEVEHFAFADGPAQAHSPWLGLAVGFGVKTIQRNGLRSGHGERLAVALDLEIEILNSLADRMVGLF